MKIGIDIDGTVTENFTLIKNLACKYFDKKETDITSWQWDFCKAFDITEDEAQKFWLIHEEEIYTIPGPKPEAPQTITKLAQEHEIVYITARSNQYACHTVKWLHQHNIYFGNLFMNKDKKKICLEHNIDVMIDDSPEYEGIAEHIPLLLFDYPYNEIVKAHQQITRIKSWQEVYKIILALAK